MLFIAHGPDSSNLNRSTFWQVREQKPLIYDEIVLIQADGHELQFLIDNSINLPLAKNKSVQTWHGDLAKFIYFNIL